MSDTTTAPTTPTITRKYEGLFLFGTNYTADVDGALDVVRSLIEKNGGNVLVLKKWDDRKLAYEIRKQTRGLYVIVYFEAPPSAITSIDRDVRLGNDVLRCMITDGNHLSAEEVEKMEPQKPEPRELDEEGRPIRRRVGAGVTSGAGEASDQREDEGEGENEGDESDED